ncbi:hypothetical protein BJ508DRAFT_331027 [Ascobolus immersus RN42]|uniref:Uncharacterized protein n=1 Tax=Ascobolus immersus RN42 TaxID=1160509 RepID=A0A3N4HVC3_ASCIM|nr:hypothetical protein BJ508DRAFT_331027 [Ascobolus immersus RN42]
MAASTLMVQTNGTFVEQERKSCTPSTFLGDSEMEKSSTNTVSYRQVLSEVSSRLGEQPRHMSQMSRASVQPRDLNLRPSEESKSLPPGAEWVRDRWGNVVDLNITERNSTPNGKSLKNNTPATNSESDPNTTHPETHNRRSQTRSISVESNSSIASRRQKPTLSMSFPIAKLSKEEQEEMQEKLIQDARNALVKPTTLRTPVRPIGSPITPRVQRTVGHPAPPAPRGVTRPKGNFPTDATGVTSARFTSGQQKAPTAPQAPRRTTGQVDSLEGIVSASDVAFMVSSNELLAVMGDMREMDGGYDIGELKDLDEFNEFDTR